MNDAGDEVRGTVLIAVSEPMVGRIIEHKLRREGHAVTSCNDAEAVADVKHEQFDVVIAEPALLSADTGGVGDECGWLAVVAAGDDAAAHAAMTRGAAGLVRTPFKPTDVAAQVDALLRMVRA
jgi:DNA-binding response OmpR family regulator